MPCRLRKRVAAVAPRYGKWIIQATGNSIGIEVRHMTAILGISAFYHDSAAALVVDGEIVAAAQEERFTRKKHDDGFPQNAVNYCLREAGISASDLDIIG